MVTAAVLVLFAVALAACAAEIIRLAWDSRADADSDHDVFDRRRQARQAALRRLRHTVARRLDRYRNRPATEPVVHSGQTVPSMGTYLLRNRIPVKQISIESRRLPRSPRPAGTSFDTPADRPAVTGLAGTYGSSTRSFNGTTSST